MKIKKRMSGKKKKLSGSKEYKKIFIVMLIILLVDLLLLTLVFPNISDILSPERDDGSAYSTQSSITMIIILIDIILFVPLYMVLTSKAKKR